MEKCAHALVGKAANLFGLFAVCSWFEGNMRNRPKPKRQSFVHSFLSNPLSTVTGLLSLQDASQQHHQQHQQLARVQLQGLVLSLLHTYHSRLASRADRQQYLQKLVAVFRRHGKTTSAAELQAILRAEQDDYLRRMELPPGIAVNEALRENVFMTLVCVLNKIPLFLVRKRAGVTRRYCWLAKKSEAALIPSTTPGAGERHARQMAVRVYF